MLSDTAARRLYSFGSLAAVGVKLPEIQNLSTVGIAGEDERFAIKIPDRARNDRHRDQAPRRRCRPQVRRDVGHSEVTVEPYQHCGSARDKREAMAIRAQSGI